MMNRSKEDGEEEEDITAATTRNMEDLLAEFYVSFIHEC